MWRKSGPLVAFLAGQASLRRGKPGGGVGQTSLWRLYRRHIAVMVVMSGDQVLTVRRKRDAVGHFLLAWKREGRLAFFEVPDVDGAGVADGRDAFAILG